MRESDIETYFTTRVKELGGEVRKLKWIGRNGGMDRFAKIPDRPALLAEIKAPGKIPKRHQQREIDRLRAVGMWVEVIDSIERVDEVLGC
jgi:hypothetical protein